MRKHNFNAGPSALPLSVLEKIQSEIVDYNGLGMSLLEISHRSKEFIAVLENTKQTLRDVLSISEEYEIVFLGGGASLQFSMIPMNFLQEGVADYVVTGSWSEKAVKEAQKIGKVHIAGSSEDKKFSYIPKNLQLSPDAKYLHITSNNTIYGTQWESYPQKGNTPIFVDMSSDIMSRKVDINNFALVYAGAQKNAGPAGVTVVIVRKDLLENTPKNIPTMMQYKIHVEKDSCYNTPPVFQIYVVGLVAQWIKDQGGLEKIEEMNNKKAALLYQTIDEYGDFYKAPVEKSSRSKMNVAFRLPSEDLEKQFVAEAGAQHFHGIKGHRSTGGIRISVYNAVSLESVELFTSFMKEFVAKQ